jgi:hypothetical protein
MRGILRWFTALVPAWILGVALIPYAIIESIVLSMMWTEATVEELYTQREIRSTYVIVLIAGYALYRATYFNPFYNQRYRSWLGCTPWRWGIPLPLGPLRLVLQDFVVIAIAVVMCHGMPDSFLLALPVLFLCAYLFPFVGNFSFVQMPISAVIVSFGLGTVVWLLSQSQLAALGISLVLYGFVYARMDANFRLFPWGHLNIWQTPVFSRYLAKLGWPNDVLAPSTSALPPLWTSIAWPLLMGWWAFALLSNSSEEARNILGGVVILGLLTIPVIETVHLLIWHKPPINLAGRLLTFRWIIPRYDVVFLPVVMTVVCYSYLWVSLREVVSPVIATPLMISIVLLLLSLFYRRRERWRLTSSARLVPGGYFGQMAKEFEQL